MATREETSSLAPDGQGSVAGATLADAERVGQAYHRERSCKIIVDSCADFAPAVVDRLGVEVISFSYIGPTGEHADDLWQSITPHEFYQYMRDNPDARFTTTAVSPGMYAEVFERAAQEGMPTLYLAFTAGLSSSFHAAEQAAEMVRAEHPDFELYVLDNASPSAAAELLCIEVVRLAGNGMSAHELYEWAKDARNFIHGYFTIDSMHWLSAGGRIPAAAAQVGGKLDVKPEFSYELNGSLSLCGMCRGRKKALRAILKDFKENYSYDKSLPLAIVSTDAEKDARWLEAQIRKEKDCEDVSVIHSSVSPVIGSHLGPGMVAVIFWGKDRRDKMSLSDRIARKIRSDSKA